jgi:hypothetical protein
MAAPNIVNVGTITGKSNVAALTTISTNLVTNVASSGKVFKVNALYISNINTVTNFSCNVALLRGGTEYGIARDMTVPADGTLDVISKAIYLEEGDALRIQGDANSAMHAVCSFEEIS